MTGQFFALKRKKNVSGVFGMTPTILWNFSETIVSIVAADGQVL